jgi:hypothetical protein
MRPTLLSLDPSTNLLFSGEFVVVRANILGEAGFGPTRWQPALIEGP